MAATDKKRSMVVEENSQNSQPKGKRLTSKTSARTAGAGGKLNKAAALEVLSASFRMVELAGVTLNISVTDEGVNVLIRDTNFIDGVLVSRQPEGQE